jgi:hypothetical protein
MFQLFSDINVDPAPSAVRPLTGWVVSGRNVNVVSSVQIPTLCFTMLQFLYSKLLRNSKLALLGSNVCIVHVDQYYIDQRNA